MGEEQPLKDPCPQSRSTHAHADPSSGTAGGLSRLGLRRDAWHGMGQASLLLLTSTPVIKGWQLGKRLLLCWLTSRALLGRQNWFN